MEIAEAEKLIAELEQRNSQLERENRTAKQSQSGQDRTITELQTKIKELEGAGDPVDDDDKVKDTALDAQREEFDRRKEALGLARKHEYTLDETETFLGLDGSDDAGILEAIHNHTDDAVKAAISETLKLNGTNPHFGLGLDMSAPSLETISNMTTQEQANVGDDALVMAMDKHKQGSKRTLRDKIRGGRG